MAHKIFLCHTHLWKLCPAILVLLSSLLSCHGQFSEHSIPQHPPFSPRIPPMAPCFFCIYRHFYKSRCLLQRDLHFSFIPFSCLNPVGSSIPWELPLSSRLSSSLPEPPWARPSCPAGTFLRSLCFLSQSKQLFHWGFQHSFFSSFQAAPRASFFSGLLLWVLFSPYFCFSLRLNTGMLNVFGPTMWLHVIVLWSLLQSSSHKQLWNCVLCTSSRKADVPVDVRTSCSKNHRCAARKMYILQKKNLMSASPGIIHNHLADLLCCSTSGKGRTCRCALVPYRVL